MVAIYRLKTNKIMSEKMGRHSKFKITSSRINVIDYLLKRATSGHQDDSKHYANKLLDDSKDLYKKDLTAHFGCVNAIEFSGDGNLLFSGGDDRRVLMWNVNDAMMYYTGKMGDGAKPFIMKGCHYSNIFCLAVDDDNKRVLSGSNDDQVIVHDYITGNPVDVFLHDSPVFSLSLHPTNGNIFVSAADSGRISLYDIRESNADLLCVAKLRTPFHGVMFNPCEPSLIATANSKVGVHIWDLRKPDEILTKCNDEPSMAVRWNQEGTTLLALRNLLPIVIYDPTNSQKKLEFDSGSYFNACTMKSCSFAGANDEYILSGSDDFNLYMWKIPHPWPESKWIGSEHLILSGHRSIVNQVRYSPSKQLIATSGVEKIIKIWSPFRLPYSNGDRDKPSSKRHRLLCSSRSCTRSPGFLSHDYSQESVEEDTRMIHFFDSLLQNELDDITFLPFPQSYYLDNNLFNVSNRKKETRVYEKLIKKKKKYLSKILIEKSDERKMVCSLNRSALLQKTYKMSRSLRKRKKKNSNSIIKNLVEPCSTTSQKKDLTAEDIDEDSSGNSSTPKGSVVATKSEASKCLVSDATSSYVHSSDSYVSMAENTSADSNKPSKFSLNFSDSDDSTDNSSQSNSVKSSVNNLLESSDSDELEVPPITKLKRSNFRSRCYRFTSKRKKRSDNEDLESKNSNREHLNFNSDTDGIERVGSSENVSKTDNKESIDSEEN